MEGVGNIHQGLEGRLQEHQAQGLLHMVSTQEQLDNLEQLLVDSPVQLASNLQEREDSLEQRVDNLGQMVGSQGLLVREHNLGLEGRHLEREDIQWEDKGQEQLVQERNLDIRELVLHNLVLIEIWYILNNLYLAIVVHKPQTGLLEQLVYNQIFQDKTQIIFLRRLIFFLYILFQSINLTSFFS